MLNKIIREKQVILIIYYVVTMSIFNNSKNAQLLVFSQNNK